MSRVPIITLAKRELIPQLVKEGKDAAQIAAIVGVTPGSLRVICSRYKISLRGKPLGEKKPKSHRLELDLPEDTHRYLQTHATQKGITRGALISRLLEHIARDNLYQAVLDE